MTYTNPGKHYFGELNNAELSEKVRRVQKAFERAGIVYETPVDMLRIMWWKFMINVGMNQASAVMRAPYGIFHKDANAQELMEALMREVIALAQAQGINLSGRDIDEWYPFLHGLSPQGKTSMLPGHRSRPENRGGDLRRKSRGAWQDLCYTHPVNETLLRIIRVLEQNPV